MTEAVERPPHISQEDWDSVDVPEMTDEQFARARPFAEMFPEAAARMMKNKGGRPKVATPKVHVGLRLPAALATWLKADGKGYNARAEAILQRAMDEATR